MVRQNAERETRGTKGWVRRISPSVPSRLRPRVILATVNSYHLRDMNMRRMSILGVAWMVAMVALAPATLGQDKAKGNGKKQEGPPAKSANPKYIIHDEARPLPPVVTPGERGSAPSDAIVLFDGKDLSAWEHKDGVAPKWQVKDGAITIMPKSGDLFTKEGFGDVQLHIEWSADPNSPGAGQRRSNAGVFLMGIYEIQVLDNYQHKNKTYADGTAGSIYGQYPPLVNASRPAGEWQVYDIIFRRPRFDASGKLVEPAYATVLHNGVLVQDHVKLLGPTSHKSRAPYRQHADRVPIKLQDHKDDPIRFRNIWVRDLEKVPQAEQ